MSAVTAPSNPSQTQNTKKRRGKAEASATVAAPVSVAASNTDAPSVAAAADGSANGHHEPSFLRELQNNQTDETSQNATAKVDAIIAENPGKSLEELVALKKINADQKAQALKKPALQETIAHIEEQIAQYKQLEAYYEEQRAKEIAKIEAQHKDEIESLKKNLETESKESSEKRFKDRLLVLSRFLRAAAAMRGVADEHSIQARGFEGALYQVYGGTEQAVDAMVKLIDGTDDKVPSVESEILDITSLSSQSTDKFALVDAQIKRTSLEDYAQSTGEAVLTEEEAAPAADANAVQTDPTIANAGLTEAEEPTVSQAAAADSFQPKPQSTAEEAAPLKPTEENVAANEIAQTVSVEWDPNPYKPSASTEEWLSVQVPQPGTAAEASVAAEAAVRQPLTSETWVEEPPTNKQVDGFERVNHPRGRGRGYRGRGQGQRGGGEHRGRGGYHHRVGSEYRGRGRGRGGEYRGNGNGHRGGRPAPAAATAGDA
ncbi:conserved hypothetical protein [Trichophyton verrucosum HKI 0517]|uniref:YAG7-like dimerisation domain-containing protein n=1 Tax=Trichophyton verrucosum (strain HKI 0517) TaxID=663202 RepID=D4D200_TRIVH|nr:uncharacterized protein TRV_01102 [Trichophyton verrucosum HKI 0517]EFE44142.1 conserved hypothetical protein [Trichophyton verrucosum HKI 0517]